MITDTQRKTIAFSAIILMVAATVVPFAIFADEEEPEPDSALVKDAVQWEALRIAMALPFWKAGDIISGVHREPPTPSGNDDAVKAYGRDVAMIYAVHELSTISGMAGGLVANDTQTWQLTQLHLNRAAEIAASSLWQEGKTYDPDSVLDYGGIYGMAANGYYNTQYSLDYGYKQGGDRIASWKSADWSAPITGRFAWASGQTPVASQNLSIDFTTIADASAAKNRIYLIKANDADCELSNTIWVFGSGGTITSVAGGPGTTLTEGKNNVSALDEGWYTLTPGTYGGLFLPSVAEDSAVTRGGVAFASDSNIGYAAMDGDNLSVWYEGYKSNSAFFKYKFASDGKTHETDMQGANSLGRMISIYADYIAGIKDVLHKSAQAGQVMWTISANARAANALLSPSSVVPQLVNVGIDADQAYAMYVSALDQIVAYNNSYGEVLKAGQVKISEESLELYCYGSLYNPDGSLLAGNVVFTPYVYIKDMSVKQSGYNTFIQDGMCMVWDDTATSASEWLGSASTDSHRVVLMCRGAYFEAEEIIYKHRAVDSVLLKVKEISQMEALTDVPLLVPEPPKVLDAETLIMIIVVELGAIIALIGYAFRTPQVIIAGLIVAVIGIIAAGWIADVALGRKGLWDWLPWRF